MKLVIYYGNGVMCIPVHHVQLIYRDSLPVDRFTVDCSDPA
jgi:hypothetical protein